LQLRLDRPGEHTTDIPGLSLFHRAVPTACYKAMYEPSLTVFVQGKKHINLGGVEYLCDGSTFLVSSIDVPVRRQIIEASAETPLLSMMLRLDIPTVREIMHRDDLSTPDASSHRRGAGIGRINARCSGRLHPPD
jgi:hypothetical protein